MANAKADIELERKCLSERGYTPAIFVKKQVDDCIRQAQSAYDHFHAGDKLEWQSPEVIHDFPEKERNKAYQFIDRHLS